MLRVHSSRLLENNVGSTNHWACSNGRPKIFSKTCNPNDSQMSSKECSQKMQHRVICSPQSSQERSRHNLSQSMFISRPALYHQCPNQPIHLLPSTAGLA